MESINFEQLNLNPRILRAVKEMGFEEPSPIQAKAIPFVMEGKDIIGQAQTGTGKTAAFGIPVLERIDPSDKHLQALILCPTRELAIQVADEIRSLAKFMHGIKVLPVYGGQNIVNQIRSLKSHVQIVVGTPGRVMDHMRRHTLKFEHLKMMILDEADEMLDMGFRDDIESILEQTPEERQTVLFSATMPGPIRQIARRYQNNATTVRVIKKELTVPKISQYYYEVKERNKTEVLTRLLDMYAPKLSLVFCNTKKGVDRLIGDLKGRGYFADGIHGDMNQAQRDRVMNRFRNGRIDILVATDVAARGIDVDDVEAVFNYDLPQDIEYYVHRIGRTGRAGREGRSFTFIVGKEIYKLKEIERHCKTRVKRRKVPSIDDIESILADKTLDQVADTIRQTDLSHYISILEKKLEDEEYTSLDIAAALLKMTVKPMERDDVEDIPEKMYDTTFANTGAKDRGMARLFINIGKKQKVRPGDILGAIAGETNLPGKLVGSIDMFDKFTFVEVPMEHAKNVIQAMKNANIKGKSIHIEPANAN
ncbi:MAG: DEAD/DEAH box helicase [Lachnospiraceae bacterium]|nr:DEAD/DEAH box helicase [Lachnospiraceae bacterium]